MLRGSFLIYAGKQVQAQADRIFCRSLTVIAMGGTIRDREPGEINQQVTHKKEIDYGTERQQNRG